MMVWTVVLIVTRWFFDETFDEYFHTTETTLIGVYESFDSAKKAMADDLNDICRETDQEVTGESWCGESDYHNEYYAVFRYSHTKTKDVKRADGDWHREYKIYPRTVLP